MQAVTQVMGILNVTPDSFSDGGLYFRNTEHALKRALQMVFEGATMIDIGGESSRPGALPVSAQEELDRVIPVIEKLHGESDVLISIDTCKASVMQEAVKAGARFINDIFALRDPDALNFVATSGVPVCLMHMQGTPELMQEQPMYKDVVSEIVAFLEVRVRAALEAGIKKENIFIDPGFGFGKNLAHNLELLRRLSYLQQTLKLPLLVGLSRKAMIATLLKSESSAPDLKETNDKRLYAGLALAVWSAIAGASIIRTHDVKPTVQALTVINAIMQ